MATPNYAQPLTDAQIAQYGAHFDDPKKLAALSALTTMDAAAIVDCVLAFIAKVGINKPAGTSAEIYFKNFKNNWPDDKLSDLGYTLCINKAATQPKGAFDVARIKAQILPKATYRSGPVNLEWLKLVAQLDGLSSQQVVDAALGYAAAVGALDKKAGESLDDVGRRIMTAYGEGGLYDLAAAILTQAKSPVGFVSAAAAATGAVSPTGIPAPAAASEGDDLPNWIKPVAIGVAAYALYRILR